MKKSSGITILSFITICFCLLINNNIIDSKEEIKDNENNENLTIEFIDVGQGDSILINDNNKYMLIDAGNNEDGEKLTNYFKSKSIKNFKYVVGTHAHEDHIGGMDNIINNFSIDTFYMPNCITTTKTFEEILDSLEKKQIAFQTPKIDSKFTLNKAEFTVLYTGEDSNDLNNTSIVLKMTYGDTSYLFMGDATSKTENQILSKNLKADVLKIGHHGSQYSTSNNFLKKVDPKFAIISVGANNMYGHPKDITLKKLNNIETHRTDLEGTIIISTDGNNINVKTIKTDTNG